jgi:hypothetical protein
MITETKNVLMIARNKKVEALRMATGLTLLDDVIRVAVIGGIDRENPDVELQIESLDFADVPVVDIDVSNAARLAEMVVESDVVFVV